MRLDWLTNMAQALVLDALRYGPATVLDVSTYCRERQMCRSRMRAALKALRVQTAHSALDGLWYWSLPGYPELPPGHRRAAQRAAKDHQTKAQAADKPSD